MIEKSGRDSHQIRDRKGMITMMLMNKNISHILYLPMHLNVPYFNCLSGSSYPQSLSMPSRDSSAQYWKLTVLHHPSFSFLLPMYSRENIVLGEKFEMEIFMGLHV